MKESLFSLTAIPRYAQAYEVRRNAPGSSRCHVPLPKKGNAPSSYR